MPTRLTILMQVTTDPPNRSDASPHTGGWSESFWAAGAIAASDPDIGVLCGKRRMILPTQASVVGFRLANYNIVGNRLVPVGSSTGKLQLAGNSAQTTDVPQMALEISGKAQGAANSSRFTLRCIPDSQIQHGEYQPTGSFILNIRKYLQEIQLRDWKFLGRDLTKPSLRVMSIAGNVVTLNGALGAAVGTDFIRFRRVYDDLDRPIVGAWPVTAQTSTTVTLGAGFNRTLTAPSGTLRIDAIALFPFGSLDISRACVRKVGRPFESYRGRQSKKTV